MLHSTRIHATYDKDVKELLTMRIAQFIAVLALGGALTLGHAVLTPAPADAVPPTLRGIDITTVLSMRDQVRAAAISHQSPTHTLHTIQTIVIDPGHGGDNQGAIGTAHVHEKFLTLDLAFDLRDQLQEKYPDARIILTRYWDRSMTLSERITLANEEGADLFLSLHYNAAVHSKAIGVETYFLTTEQAIPDAAPIQSKPVASVQPTAAGLPDTAEVPTEPAGTYNDAMLTLQRDLARATQHERSGLLAELVQGHLVDKTHSPDRGVKQANFGVLRGALMPAVVVEAGFVTHPSEGKKVMRDTHRQHIVDALMLAVEDFDDAIATQNAK